MLNLLLMWGLSGLLGGIVKDDDEEYFEDEKKEVSKKRNEVDLYQIGDIINFIETIKIKKV